MVDLRREILRVIRRRRGCEHDLDLREWRRGRGRDLDLREFRHTVAPYNEIPGIVKEAVLWCWLRYCCPKHRREMEDCVEEGEVDEELLE